MFRLKFQSLILFLTLLVVLVVSVQSDAQSSAQFALSSNIEITAATDSSNIESIKCKMVVPAQHYIMAESFFANFDNVVKRMAFLQRHGFQRVAFIHTTCQEFDVNKELYAVVIGAPVPHKTMLYNKMFELQDTAREAGIHLITTRIIHCRR